MIARRVILFLALVVMATATFDDANAWLEPLPAIRKLPIALRIAILYIPAAGFIAILWISARLGPRVQGHMAWFASLVLLSVATILTPYATPALMLAVALVLMRVSPRIGNLYDAVGLPSVRMFLGFTLLLAMSLKWGEEIFGMDLLMERMANLPLDALGIAICAVAVAIFIIATDVRHRRVQPCSAGFWLTLGVILGIAGVLSAHLPSNVPYGFFLSAGLGIAGHLALFVGAFLLLTHLLPVRDADRAH
jgi:hypothetical protein